MTFEPRRGHYYRMPIFFGPMYGPREWPAGKDFDFCSIPRRVVAGTRFLGERDQLAALLPDCFEVWGDPLVTVEITYFTELGWLAGRGYNMCDVKFDAVFRGKNGPVHGTLVLVRWENLADPILSGREELGHNKLYCEIPPLNVADGRHSACMGWMGTPFLDVEVWDLEDAISPLARNTPNEGMLSYKYVPATGKWGEADVEYATLTPSAPNVTTVSRRHGKGKATFRRSSWGDLPTLHHIVNAFADLHVLEWRDGYLLEQVGGSSAADTRRLE